MEGLGIGDLVGLGPRARRRTLAPPHPIAVARVPVDEEGHQKPRIGERDPYQGVHPGVLQSMR